MLPAADRAPAQAGAAARLRAGRPIRTTRSRRRWSSRSGSSRIPTTRCAVPDGLAGPEARYEQREAIELAFIAALQHLPARQRAVLLLRDVLGFAPAEIAEMLDVDARPSVYSALQRARKAVDERLPERSQQATLRALGDDAAARDRRALRATRGSRGDVDAIVAMLDRRRGRSRCRRGRPGTAAATPIRALPRRAARCSSTRRWRLVPVQASGQLGVRAPTAATSGRVVAAARDPGADARAGRPDRRDRRRLPRRRRRRALRRLAAPRLPPDRRAAAMDPGGRPDLRSGTSVDRVMEIR